MKDSSFHLWLPHGEELSLWRHICQGWSSFLIKRNSTESDNLKACNSFHYNGLIHCKTMGVGLEADHKGVMVVMQQRSGQRKPATSSVRTTIHPQQHRAHDPQKQVAPGSAHGRHPQGQCHPAQQEASDGEEEAARRTRSAWTVPHP